jgi:hypothetical protein
MRRGPEEFNSDHTLKTDILMLFTTAQELEGLGNMKIGVDSGKYEQIQTNPDEDSC